MALQIFIKPIDRWSSTETKNPGNSQFRNTYAEKKCKSCGDMFDPNQAIQVDVDDEDMLEELLSEHAKGEKCFDCIFEKAFIDASTRGFE